MHKLGYHKYYDYQQVYALLDGSEEEYNESRKSQSLRPVSGWQPEGVEEEDEETWMWNTYYPEDYEGIYQLCLKLSDAEPITTDTTVSPFSFSSINMIVSEDEPTNMSKEELAWLKFFETGELDDCLK